MIMTPAQFEEKMTELKEKAPNDVEMAHYKADEIMCELLRSYGYDSGIDIFKSMPKWYA